MSRARPGGRGRAATIPTSGPVVYAPAVKLGPVSTFDRWVDERFAARLRDFPVADRVFYAASALGDHGLIWLILAVVRGLRSDSSELHPTVRAMAAVGIESMLVNGPIKWVFRRQRPPSGAANRLPLRQPRTSSFPSGHATSAFCAATLLSDGDPALRPLYYGLAVIVAWSRIHVRVHYASDVIGGVIIGVALGQIIKRLVPLPPASSGESPSPPSG